MIASNNHDCKHKVYKGNGFAVCLSAELWRCVYLQKEPITGLSYNLTDAVFPISKLHQCWKLVGENKSSTNSFCQSPCGISVPPLNFHFYCMCVQAELQHHNLPIHKYKCSNLTAGVFLSQFIPPQHSCKARFI